VAADTLLSSVLKSFELDSGEADVIEIIRSNPNDERAQILAVTSLVETRKQAQQTPANPGAVMPTGGGGAVEGDTLESVTAELQEAYAEKVLDMDKVMELKAKQEELLPKQ
jgi:hypothetical protein